MQGSFAFYLMDGLTEKPITHNDIDELRWWRRNVAHSLEYYSEAKGESLARRVCDNDFGIEASGVQAGLHATLNEYLGDYFKRSERPRLLAPMPGARTGDADLPGAPGSHMGAGRPSPWALPTLATLAAPGRGCGPRWYDGRDALAGPKDHTH